MLKKPEFIPQAQETTQNPSNTLVEAEVIDNKVGNNLQEGQIINSVQNPIINTEDKEIVIKKKAQYRSFMKLIKQGKYTTAVMTSKILGVDRGTLTSWLQTKKVQQLMNETYDSYISDISGSKDWKAKAYLLDKLEGSDKTEQQSVNLTNLIQINTVSPTE